MKIYKLTYEEIDTEDKDTGKRVTYQQAISDNELRCTLSSEMYINEVKKKILLKIKNKMLEND